MNLTVAADAGNSTVQVGGVIEVNVVGGFVNANPFDGLSFDKVAIGIFQLDMIIIHGHRRAQSSELGRTFFYVLVAVPTGIGAWHIGVSGVLNKTVTIPAIHSELTHMKVVVVMDWLSGLVTDSLSLGSCIIGDSGNNAGTEHSKTNRNFQRQ
jgi:hypothetical protein